MENNLFFLLNALASPAEGGRTPEDDGEELVNKIRSGDSKAEDELFYRFGKKMALHIRSKIGVDNPDWKDVLQHSLIAVFEVLKEDRFDPERGTLGRLIWGITRNKIRDYQKGKIRKTRKEINCDDALFDRISDEVLSIKLEKEEQVKILHLCLEQLPSKYTRVLKLRYFEELLMKEIGQQLNLSEQQVIDLHRHGLKKLKEIYEKFYQ